MLSLKYESKFVISHYISYGNDFFEPILDEKKVPV